MNNFDLASTLTQSRARAAAKLCPAWHPQRLYALITTIKPPSCVLYEGSEIKVPQAHKRKPEPRCSTGSVASCKRCNEWPSVPLCKKKSGIGTTTAAAAAHLEVRLEILVVSKGTDRNQLRSATYSANNSMWTPVGQLLHCLITFFERSNRHIR